MSPKIGLQLYSLRDRLQEDLVGTLRDVAALGYAGIETAFFDDIDTSETAGRELRDLEIEVVAARTSLPLGSTAETVFRSAEALGAHRIVWHGWPEDARYASVVGIRQLAAEFNRAHQAAAARGLAFAIHNHWWECQPVEGQLPYRVLLAELDPAIGFEFDAYWAKVAGLDPVSVIAELGNRLVLLHLKDGPLRRHEPMVALGAGSLEIPALLEAISPATEWVVVELDEVLGDPLAAVERSRTFLIGLGLPDH